MMPVPASQVKVWNLTNCKLKNNLVGHTGYVNTVTVSPDGSLCASGGKDGERGTETSLSMCKRAGGRILTACVRRAVRGWARSGRGKREAACSSCSRPCAASRTRLGAHPRLLCRRAAPEAGQPVWTPRHAALHSRAWC